MNATTARDWMERARVVAMSVLGLFVVVMPLALWVSWTEAMFVGIIGLGAGAAGLYCLLTVFEARAVGPGRQASARTVSRLDDELVAELSRLNPMVYHNRRSAERRVQETFDKVKDALERDQGGD